VHTTVLDGNVIVPVGDSRVIPYPCFNVGAGAQPGDYSLDILWTGQDAMGNPVNVDTDPTLHLYYYSTTLGVSTGGVGGVVLPVNKLDLVSSIAGRIMLMAGVIALSVFVWRKRRGRAKKARST
jgi:hypothetical protein